MVVNVYGLVRMWVRSWIICWVCLWWNGIFVVSGCVRCVRCWFRCWFYCMWLIRVCLLLGCLCRYWLLSMVIICFCIVRNRFLVVWDWLFWDLCWVFGWVGVVCSCSCWLMYLVRLFGNRWCCMLMRCWCKCLVLVRVKCIGYICGCICWFSLVNCVWWFMILLRVVLVCMFVCFWRVGMVSWYVMIIVGIKFCFSMVLLRLDVWFMFDVSFLNCMLIIVVRLWGRFCCFLLCFMILNVKL